ncbi:MAG TPA: thiamine-phosphate kinase [Nitrosospira sp.]|nr:thiamine-phosphate kinase [Nitrosospira sp.]
MLSEFEIIQRYFTRAAPGAILGIGDDAALIGPSAGLELAISTDMLVSGTHFLPGVDPRKLGHKSLAVNLSDMAAMGANPRWAMLALALPASMLQMNEKWLGQFAAGFFELADAHEVNLIGGDTTRGPLTVSVTIIGEVAAGAALRRSGARPGDDIWISGQLGGAALALAHQLGQIVLQPDELGACLPALETPVPRVGLGQRLIGVANSAIDISDGLLADLGHILDCSKVAGVIRMAEISCPASLRKYLHQPLAVTCLLAGGDDYELCFTAPRTRRREIETLSREQQISVTRIGEITEGNGLVVLDATGRAMALDIQGYDHFRT